MGTTHDRVPGSHRPVPARPTPADLPRARLLVVESASDAGSAYSRALAVAGFDVALAAGGSEALARAVASRPDAIVLEPGATRLDGLDLTRRLKAANATRVIPVIALADRGPLTRAARAAGCDGVLAMPCPAADLAAEVERRLRERRLRPRRRGRAGRS